MSTYKLNETPDVFISSHPDDAYTCRMYSIKGDSNQSYIRAIDIRKDKLVIYETEIKETIWEKLRNSLLLLSKVGRIFVNCNGECFINITDKNSFYRPIENVIFDWSLFGVVVPNSAYEVLRRQLLQKDQELAAMNSLQKTWEASKQENEELKKQLSACTKEQLDKEIELQKVRSQLCVKKFELDSTNMKFELLKEEVKELQEHVSASNMKAYKNMELEHQMVVTVHQQLYSTMSELKLTKDMWELSKEQLLNSKKEIEDMRVKVQSMHDQVSSVLLELQSNKIELEASEKKVVELESQLLSRGKENQDITKELEKVKNEFSSSNLELQLTKTRLESSCKKIIELEEQVSSCKKVQEQLSLIMNELQSIKVLSDFTAEKVVELEDQCSDKSYVIKAIGIVDDKSELHRG